MYKFAADSFICQAANGDPEMLKQRLKPGRNILGKSQGEIEFDILENVVGEYLGSLDSPYKPNVEGRLVNSTEAVVPLAWVQTTETCSAGTYCVENIETCEFCPVAENVTYTQQNVAEFIGRSGDTTLFEGFTSIVNAENYSVLLNFKSKPSSLCMKSSADVENLSVTVDPHQQLNLEYQVPTLSWESGTALASLSFGVLDGGEFPGCEGRDAVLEVLVKVNKQPALLMSGWIHNGGLLLMGFVLAGAIFHSCWVYTPRKHQVVRKMQPIFLVTLCARVSILALSIVSLSLEDHIVLCALRSVHHLTMKDCVGWRIVRQLLVAVLLFRQQGVADAWLTERKTTTRFCWRNQGTVGPNSWRSSACSLASRLSTTQNHMILGKDDTDKMKDSSASLLARFAGLTQSSCKLLGVRSIGVDYGLIRTGVAKTAGYQPTAIEILTDMNATAVATHVVRFAQLEGASKIILGLPLHKNGTVAEQTNLTLAFGQVLAQSALKTLGPDVSVEVWDERYTSKEAAARAHARNPHQTLYGMLDAEAACIILEQYYNDNGQDAQIIQVLDDQVRADCLQAFQRQQAKELAQRQSHQDERERLLQRRREAIQRDQQANVAPSGTASSGGKKKKKRKRR